jgi:hypothetical protein
MGSDDDRLAGPLTSILSDESKFPFRPFPDRVPQSTDRSVGTQVVSAI